MVTVAGASKGKDSPWCSVPTREPQVLMGSTSWDAGQQNMPQQEYACVRRHLLLGPPVRESA